MKAYLWLLQAKELKLSEKGVLMVIMAYCGKKDHAWPSEQTIAETLGITTRTVKSAVKRLEALGCIHIDHSKRYNTYTIIDHQHSVLHRWRRQQADVVLSILSA